MQVISVMTPALHIPDWVDSFLAIAFIAGFPIAMILAWVFDVTSDGVVRTDELDPDNSHALTTDQQSKRGVSKNAPLRVIAISTVGIVSMIALWYSPMGKTFMTSPETRNVETGLALVKNFTQKNAIPEAQKLFSGMLADNPDHAAARAGLALALMREYTHLEHDPALIQRAKSMAEAALRSDEHLALANIAVGWAAEFAGEFETAHKSYDRADILDPENIFTLEGRARTFNKQRNMDAALETLERGISLYPNYGVYYSIAGENLSNLDEYARAEAMFRHAITLTKDNPRAYAQLAHTLHHQGKTTEAIRVLQDGLQINETALLYSNLGALLFFQGQYEMSAGAFERTLEFAGDSHDYLYWANLADAYRWVPGKMQDAYIAYDRAMQLLQVKLEKQPENKTNLSRAALYHAKRGNLELARQGLARVSFADPVPVSVFYRATVIYEILADRKQALAMLDRALQAGYPLTEILNDPELKNLRQDTDYHRLLATQESNL